MNIHFQNQELLEQLNNNVIFKIEVGSIFYDLKNELSDTDYLCIYIDSIYNKGTFNSNHHLQYNDVINNTNYIYCTIEQFVANILNGDSTVNYEVSKTEEFKEKFPELYLELYFKNVFIIKSYLGLVKRDLKKLKQNYSGKLASHFIRGLIFAEKIISHLKIDLEVEEIKFLKELKEEKNILSLEKIEKYEKQMNDLRENLKIEKIDLVKFYEIEKEVGKINRKYSELMFNNINSKHIFIKSFYFNDFGKI